jgi:hypothetical protein
MATLGSDPNAVASGRWRGRILTGSARGRGTSEKDHLLAFADSQSPDGRGSNQRHRPDSLRVCLSPLSGPFRLRHLRRDDVRVRLDAFIQEQCDEGLGSFAEVYEIPLRVGKFEPAKQGGP